MKKPAEQIALFVLLAVVGLRPLISRDYDATDRETLLQAGQADAVWAPVSRVIDVAVLLVAGAVCAHRIASTRSRYRRSGLEIGAGLLVIAAIISCLFAGEKRSAIDASFGWLSALLLVIALIQLLDAAWKIRLALCVIVASGGVSAVECFRQQRVSDETRARQLAELRAQMSSRLDIPANSPAITLMEQRVRSGEATAYFTHSNVAGGYLLLMAFGAAGLVLAGLPSEDARRGRLRVVVGVAPVAVALVALGLTRSTGAITATVAAAALFIIRAIAGSRVQRNYRKVFLAGWGVCLGAVGAVVVFGLWRGGLPGTSLDFRWHYWTASAELFRDHFPTGVGGQNFGDAYLQYKSIASPEEVESPHNFLVQFATEFGVIGLLAVLALLVGGSHAATEPAPQPRTRPKRFKTDWGSPAQMAGWGVMLLVAITAACAVLLPAYSVRQAMVRPALIWGIGFAWVVGLASGGEPRATGLVRLRSAVNFGLFAFLLQDTINVALFIPGSRTTFLAMVAVSIACRHVFCEAPAEAVTRTARRWIPVVGYAVLVVCAVVFQVPPIRAEAALRQARASREESSPTIQTHPAHLAYVRAAELDRLDATIPAEHGRWLRLTAAASRDPQPIYDLALRATDEAIVRAPGRFLYWRRKARLHLLRGQLTGDRRDYQAGVEALRQALDLYPQRPRTHLELGIAWTAVGTESALVRAIEHFEQALALDDQRPAWEVLTRFSEDERRDITQRIEQARRRLKPSIDHVE